MLIIDVCTFIKGFFIFISGFYVNPVFCIYYEIVFITAIEFIIDLNLL